jgi:gluconokinase
MARTAQSRGGGAVLTIDVGSSSIRTNLFTRDARQIEEVEAQVKYLPKLTPDGGVEIAPEELLDCIFKALDDTLAKAGPLADGIEAVGVCSLVGNVLGVDAEGKATTPVYTWADTRCRGETARLRSEIDQTQVLERTGCPIHSAYLPARLLWLKRTLPDAYRRTTRWLSIGDWLQLNLFGEVGQSLSVASWNGLLDRHALDWDREWLKRLGIDEGMLPPLVDNNATMAGLRGRYAKRWPALRDAPWFPCIADGVTGNIGGGCLRADELAVQVGTSGAMRAIVPGSPRSVPWGLWCYRVDRATSLLGGALSEGGNVLAWLSKVMNVEDRAAIEHEAAQLPPDSHGLTVLPFLAGERSPGWDDSAQGTISGLSLDTSRAEITRAAQEAIAYRFGLVYDLLKAELPPVRRVVASGGALLNVDGWTQMLADVLGTPVTASEEWEASSRGTALLALHALGTITDLSAFPAAEGKTYQPDMGKHDIYRRAMERQGRLYERMK